MPLFLNLFRRLAPQRAETERSRRGRQGESAAVRCLRRKGYRIVARNWRHGQLEIDIVARDGATLVFGEVRTRAATSLTPGIHSLTQRKRTAQRRAAQAYLKSLRSPPRTWRFDLLDVRHEDGNIVEVLHHENIGF